MTAYAVIMIYCGYKLHIKVTERIYSTTTKRFIKIYRKKERSSPNCIDSYVIKVEEKTGM